MTWRTPLVLALSALAVGCVGRLESTPLGDVGGDASTPAADGATVEPGSDADVPSDLGVSDFATPPSDMAGSNDAGPPPPRDASLDTGAPPTGAAAVCARWNADRADRSEGSSWAGSSESCSAGDMGDAARDRAMKQANLYRFLAGLPDNIDHDPVLNQRCQEAALMMDANRSLSHTPPTTWACYTADGALAAGKSNLSGGGSGSRAVSSVDRYMLDRGAHNAPTIGHRRWILSESVGPWGFGSTNAYSCMYVINGRTGPSAARPFVAWPASGITPIQAWGVPGTAETIDDTGWTVQSETLPVDGATATVTRDGATLPTVSASLLANYGSRYALKITPQGWRAEAGSTYHVSISGTGVSIEYDVEVVDCDAL